MSLGTLILTVEPGRGGEGSFVSRNNDSNCRTRERGGGRGHSSLGTMILGVERRGGHLSLGTITLFQVHCRERGRGGVMGAICL